MATLRFRGVPQGGSVRVWIKGRIVELQTQPDENLGQIAAEVATMINANQSLKEQGITAKAHGTILNIEANEVWVYLCTADKGLLLPAPPRDFRVEKGTDGIFHLSWKVPPGGYDRIHILRGDVPIADGISGENTSFGDYFIGERSSYTIFGIKDGMPSCAATF